MRKSRLALAAALSILAADDAHAVAVSFTGSLALRIATLSPIVIPGTGVAIVNGSGGPGHLTALGLPAGAFATAGLVLPITDPAAVPIRGVQATVANGAASFAGYGGSGSFGGVMPLAGFAKVCLFGPCSAPVANMTVPLHVVGAGGFVAPTAAMNFTVIGAPWTTGTASVGTFTAMGGVAPASSTDTITLVTPVFISTSIAPSAVIPVFAYLSVGGLSVPEPGTLILLTSGIVALVAMGRRHVRS